MHKHEHENCHHNHDCNKPHARSHSHAHSHLVARGEEGSRAMFKALLVTFIFMVVEIVGGYLSNSLALISDAAHMLTDIGAILLSLFAFWVARRPSTPQMSYGYHRAEILGALASGLAIWLIAGALVYQAIVRLMAPPEVKGPLVLIVATLGLIANLVSMAMLHKAQKHNLNVKGAYLHMLTDSLGSVAAIIAGAVLMLTNWRPIDPIVTIVFAVLMLFSSWELVKESVGILMESTPVGVDPETIKESLSHIAGVDQVHDLHVWTLSSGRLALSVHIISKDPEQAVLNKAHQVLQQEYGIIHTTIQIENPSMFDSERCYDCARH